MSKLTFSQRQNLEPISLPLQLNSVSIQLRNGLWNVYKLCILDRMHESAYSYSNNAPASRAFDDYMVKVWINFLKRPIDTIPNERKDRLRAYFFECEWNRLYDFLEFSMDNVDTGIVHLEEFAELCNKILKREFSGYRILNHHFIPITNEEEISTVETALNQTSELTGYKGANTHLVRALQHMSDKHNPDYRNSIKESISAVESIVKVLSGEDKSSLGPALDRLKSGLKLHQTQVEAFKKLYGYTSDAAGIRHALLEEEGLDFNDAKFMIISCSAFINYLLVKADKEGYRLD